MAHKSGKDNDLQKGATENTGTVEQRFDGQLPHGTGDPLIEGNDTDFPEPGYSPEHTGEKVEKAKGDVVEKVDQDPGHRQKENQNKKGDDPLAA